MRPAQTSAGEKARGVATATETASGRDRSSGGAYSAPKSAKLAPGRRPAGASRWGCLPGAMRARRRRWRTRRPWRSARPPGNLHERVGEDGPDGHDPGRGEKEHRRQPAARDDRSSGARADAHAPRGRLSRSLGHDASVPAIATLPPRGARCRTRGASIARPSARWCDGWPRSASRGTTDLEHVSRLEVGRQEGRPMLVDHRSPRR